MDVKLILGDCLEKMKDIPDCSVDMVITSPPYKIGKNYDESINYSEFINAASKKLSNNGVFVWQTGNMINNGFIEPIDIITYPLFIDCSFSMINRVVWTFGHGAHCKNRLSGRYEVASVYAKTKNYIFNLDDIRIPQKYPEKKHYKGPKKGELSGNPNGKNPGDVWNITNVKHNHPEKTAHPCQYPESLCERLVAAFSNPNDTILDPFMGSGTTGVACKNLNRHFIGIEKDEKYFEIAKNRIEGS